jgi:hypothetical protein
LFTAISVRDLTDLNVQQFSVLRRCPAPLRIAAFAMALLLIWAPLAAPIYGLVSYRNLVSIVTMALLYIEFIVLVQIWGRYVYCESGLLQSYGLRCTWQNGQNLLLGLGFSSCSLVALFGLQETLGWLVWKSPTLPLPRILLEGLLMALLIGFVEELLFRGWLLDELQRDYSSQSVLWLNSSIFALMHLIKPLEDALRMVFALPTLLLFGIAMVWAKRSSHHPRHPKRGLLGLPIGLHAGLVWVYYVIDVGQLVQYTQRVPEWLTGIDKNPLSSVTGLLFMGTIALLMRQYAKP